MPLLLTVFILLTPLAQAQDPKDSLNRGVQAFRQARYPEAIAAFQEAVRLDPNFVAGHLYLATAYMTVWIPGAQNPENAQNARAAEAEFRRVLELDPAQITALNSLASISLTEAGTSPPAEQPAKLDAARDLYRRILQLDPANREAYYALGVIAWRKWYPALMAARRDLGMAPEAPGPLRDDSVRHRLRSTYDPVIEEGISNLEAALRIDSASDDAMAYMNLLIRERADLRDSPQECSRYRHCRSMDKAGCGNQKSERCCRTIPAVRTPVRAAATSSASTATTGAAFRWCSRPSGRGECSSSASLRKGPSDATDL